MSLKFTSKSLFCIGPIAQTIVSHLKVEEFMDCFEVCRAWNLALNRPFLWRESLRSALKTLNTQMEAYVKRQQAYPGEFDEFILYRQKFWMALEPRLCRQEVKLLFLLIGQFQFYKSTLENYQPFRSHIARAARALDGKMYQSWGTLNYPEFIARIVANIGDHKFFQNHLCLMKEADMETADMVTIDFFKMSMRMALSYAGKSQNWWMVAGMLRELPQNVLRMKTERKGQTIVHEAAKWGHGKIFQLVLGKFTPEILLEEDKNLNTALHLAVNKQNHDIVKKIVSEAPEECFIKQNIYGRTALHLALMKGPGDIVQMLIDKGFWQD